MASSTGYLPVDGPRPGEPTKSLLATARALGRIIGTLPVTTADFLPAEGQPDVLGRPEDWERGIVFRPTYCGTGGAVQRVCAPTDVDLSDRPSNVQADPLFAEVYTDCSSLAEHDRDDAAQAAIQLLNVAQHGLIGNEFWTGTAAQAATPDLPNDYLAKSPNEVTAGGAIDALAALEDALAGVGADACGGGARSMIHATPATVTVWNNLGLLRTEGGLLLTALDTVVVTGPGYDGSSPAGAAGTWAYGTGMVDVRLGRPKALRYIERSVNTIQVHAFRPFITVWDGCCHLAVNVDITDRA